MSQMVNVDAWFNKYQGKSLLVPGASEADRGQCVQAVDYALNDSQYGYGLPYVWLNAIDWWRNFDSQPTLKNNFNKNNDGSIKVGDIVIFNENVGSVYGHIDLATTDGSYASFVGADSNWGGNKTVHKVQHNNSSYILGVLRPKGSNMPEIVSTNTLRIGHSEIGGWDRAKCHDGSYDALFRASYPNTPADDFIYIQWQNGGDYRALKDKWASFYNEFSAQVPVMQQTISSQTDQIATLSKQNTDLQTKLSAYENGNTIIITKKGWMGLFDVIQQFFKAKN